LKRVESLLAAEQTDFKEIAKPKIQALVFAKKRKYSFRTSARAGDFDAHIHGCCRRSARSGGHRCLAKFYQQLRNGNIFPPEILWARSNFLLAHAQSGARRFSSGPAN
jgi:hypothetical protein